MFPTFDELLTGLAGAVRARKRQKPSAKSTIRPHVEGLEQRLALSASTPTAPAGCCCPSCSGAEPFVAAGASGATAAGDAFVASGYRWGQTSPGAPVTITYSYS